MASLRLLCDETVGRKQFFPRLQSSVEAYHVLDQSELGTGVSDRRIRRFALERRLNVFTNDVDFLDPEADGDHPGVVFYDETASLDEVLQAVRVVDQLLETDVLQENELVVEVPGSWG